MSDGFEMSNVASDAPAKQLAGLMSKTELQVKTVANQKTSKLTAEEKGLHTRLLASARTLVESLKRDFKRGEYDDMAESIAEWRNGSHNDRTRLEQLVQQGRLGLTPVLTLVGHIVSIEDAVS